MELRHLRYFVAVAEELNFRRAATRLHVAQPSLGRQVRDLEEELGEPLLERDRRRVALTTAGRVFLDKARELLVGAETAIHATREAGRQARGALRIGNVGMLAAPFLPGSLAAFRQRFPCVDVEIFEMTMDEQVDALLAGTIQVGFVVRVPGAPLVSGLQVRTVLSCAVAVALPTRHPRAAARTLPLKSLAAERFLDLQRSQGVGYGLGCGRFASGSVGSPLGSVILPCLTPTPCLGSLRRGKAWPSYRKQSLTGFSATKDGLPDLCNRHVCASCWTPCGTP